MFDPALEDISWEATGGQPGSVVSRAVGMLKDVEEGYDMEQRNRVETIMCGVPYHDLLAAVIEKPLGEADELLTRCIRPLIKYPTLLSYTEGVLHHDMTGSFHDQLNDFFVAG
jgi:hypothetical protein